MAWLEPIKLPDLYNDNGEFNYKKPNFEVEPPINDEVLTVLAEFFLMPAFIDNNTRTILDIEREHLFNLIFNKVSIHFKDVKIDETEIKMMNLKAETEQLLMDKIEDKLINPIISNLYGTSSRPRLKNIRGESYIVRRESLHPYENDSFNDAWRLISNIVQAPIIPITPFNWYLSDNLKSNAALRFFTYSCKQTILIVDEESKFVTGLDLVIY
ncbi:hypothetical protein IIE26_27020 (plasmid) [Cytobacillus oceanisediminis]|uniref:hypothetical protein n=1 Tax=Cytobacillus oceanisediminis TaxID=665099 RepID=UPI001865438B|nr:hypothetical protein [Cytobacillus oceanisediminis]QOK30022.1 hypothetical protein IIE26_27020 [Cytobacillus oceanisediminis]